jgi:hypothetical protein
LFGWKTGNQITLFSQLGNISLFGTIAIFVIPLTTAYMFEGA